MCQMEKYLPSRATDILDLPRYYSSSFNVMEIQRGEMIFSKVTQLINCYAEVEQCLAKRMDSGTISDHSNVTY